ncbi:MAG: 50S ribosomal protein L1 [Verrucomicrobia bacterium]|jgi:large subunit ribosomal protein L1|nr:50S ribosomal protein L1 [Verrucomicrobiota bacterium]
MSSKRYRKALELVDATKQYTLAEALEVLKKMPATKFDQTVEIAIKLGVDPRQSDQMVRGTVPLPHGSGKNVRVLVFTSGGESEQAAKDAGAEFVGFDEYIKKVSEGWVDFDVAIATPAAMAEVRKLGRVLGPRGLMPNPRTGTVTDDTAKAVTEVKAGRVEFKIDKTANLHVPVGKVSFDANQLSDNIMALVDAVSKSKPSSAKGAFLLSCTVSATMSPGLALDLKSLQQAAAAA